MLKEKWAIVTGASSGIGLATAKLFSQNGAKLILIARDESRLKALKEELESETHIFSVDVSRYDEIKECFLKIRKITKNIDILVNNAGILKSSMFIMTNQSSIEELFRINTFSQMYMAQFASKMMIKQKRGSIINISSIMGVSGSSAHAAYSASKAAIVGFTKSLAKELAPIRVNAVAPGVVMTPLIDSLTLDEKEELVKKIPLKRLASPKEIAMSIMFLASEMSSYITASVLEVDGGLCSI